MRTRIFDLASVLAVAGVGVTYFVLFDLAMSAGLAALGVVDGVIVLAPSAPHHLACALLAGLLV